MIPKSGYRFSEKHALGLDPKDHAPNAKIQIMIDPMLAPRSKAKVSVATRAGGAPIAFPGAMLIFAYPIVVHAQS